MLMERPVGETESGSEAGHTVLIVDDTPENLTVLGEWLRPHYRVRVANNGERALKAAASEPRPDLILLDIMMPGIDGYEVLRRLRLAPETADIPVIFITAMTATEDELTGLGLGAVDYIVKPFVPAVVMARVQTQLAQKRARDGLKRRNLSLEAQIATRINQVMLSQDLTVRALTGLAEIRDLETGLHIVRTQKYVELLGLELQSHPDFKAALSDGRLEKIVKAAPLHDIGKVGIPDAILRKNGKLTTDEFETMKRHTLIGAAAFDTAIKDAEVLARKMADSDTLDFLHIARDTALCHHEKWDGSGYPYGSVGKAIPVSARLMAVADVFDALMSKRIYKPAFSLEETTAIMLEGRGRHFDPDVIDAFMARRDEFARIASELADTGEPTE